MGFMRALKLWIGLIRSYYGEVRQCYCRLGGGGVRIGLARLGRVGRRRVCVKFVSSEGFQIFFGSLSFPKLVGSEACCYRNLSF